MKKLLTLFFFLIAYYSNAQIITTIAGGLGILNEPVGVAIDDSGNVYIADRSNNVVRKVNSSGVISIFAGNGTPGYSGDGGSAMAAELNQPQEVAVDGSGNLYIADLYNNVIRKVNSSGIITTIAGNGYGAGTGVGGYSGDGGPATAAELRPPFGVALDRIGNVYIADRDNNVIRKVNNSGIISTFAGNGYGAGLGYGGYNGDGGSAIGAELNRPTGVAVDGSGNIYIADWQNGVIRKVNSSGIINTFAGTGTWGYSGDGGPATVAELYLPQGVAVDGIGNVYIADFENRIRKVNSSGIISTFAGNGIVGYSGDGGPATAAEINQPTGVAVDRSRNVYIADFGNNVIRKVGACSLPSLGLITGDTTVYAGSTITLSDTSADGTWSTSNSNAMVSSSGIVTGVSSGIDTINYTVNNSCGGATVNYPITVYSSTTSGIFSCSILNTIAGNGISGYGGDGGVATLAELYQPVGVFADNLDNVYIGDELNNCIRKVNSSGIITTFAGNGTAGYSGDGGPATLAELANPIGIAMDSIGNIYIGDWANQRVRMVSTAGIITTVAGNGSGGFSGDGGNATSAELWVPIAVAVDRTGNLYIADQANNRIRKVNNAGVITTIAGNGIAGYGGDGGIATLAELYYPDALAIDGANNVYIADGANNRIRKVNSSGIISSIAGNGIAGYTGDGGPASLAELSYPTGVAVDGYGNVYIADQDNGRIRIINSYGLISTVAGNGVVGYSGDGGPATSGSISPFAVYVDAHENIYISGDPSRIRKVTYSLTPISVVIGTSQICAGNSITLIDSTPGGVWLSSNSAIATIDSSGIIRGLSTGVDSIIYQQSSSCGSKDTFLLVTVNPTPTITAVSGISICSGITTTLTATGGTFYSWSPALVLSTTTGTSVIATPTLTTTYTVTGSNIYGCSNEAILTVTVNPTPTITVSPELTICSGSSATLTATGGTSYSWSPALGLSTTAGASVLANPTSTTTYSITGSNSFGCSNDAIVTVTVNPTPTINAGSGMAICLGSSATLTATGGIVYSWSPALGLSTSTTASVIATPSLTTTYSVTGSNSYGCSNEAVVTVTVNPTPTISAGSGINLCYGLSTPLTATGGTIYSWSPALGLSATSGDSVTANPTVSTTYSVTGINSFGCAGSAAATIMVTVNPSPTVTVSPGMSICAGSTATLTAVGGTSYTWLPSSGLSTTTAASVIDSPTHTTTYSVTGSNSYGCSNEAILTVTVNPTPTISAGSGINLCFGSSATLTATGGTSYTWSPTLGLSTTTSTSVTANPTITTTYSVTGSNSFGCSNEAIVTVTVNPTPTITTSAGMTICAGSTATLTATGGTSYSWSPALGLSTTTTASVIANPTITTTYSVTGSNSYGCSNEATITVTVNPTPLISASAGFSVCAGSSATLTATGGTSYLWSPASGLSAETGASITATPITTITYSVTGTNGYGCSGASAVTITVVEAPIAGNIAGSNTVCVGAAVTLSDSVAGGTWYANNTNATITDGIVTGYTAGADTIIYTLANDCSKSTADLDMLVIPLPDAGNLSGDSSVCIGATVILTDAAPGGVWSVINANVSLAANLCTGVEAGTDVVSYSVSNNCGTATATKNMLVLPLPAPTVTMTGFELTTQASYAAYQWYKDNTPIPGATNDTCMATDTGSYYVTVTNQDGCMASSAIHDFAVTSLSEAGNLISIYPNPVTATLYIQSPIKVDGRLITIDGRIVYEQKDISHLDMGYLPNAIYLFTIYDYATGARLKTLSILKVE